MKSLLLGVALLVATPATAAVIEPVGYAVTYCNLRSIGTSHENALETAVVRNINPSEPATTLSSGIDLDVRLGFLGVKELCPHHLQ